MSGDGESYPGGPSCALHRGIKTVTNTSKAAAAAPSALSNIATPYAILPSCKKRKEVIQTSVSGYEGACLADRLKVYVWGHACQSSGAPAPFTFHTR